MKLYEPHGNHPAIPAVVVEEENGDRWLVRSHWTKRVPYTGSVRKDPIAVTLRGMAWSMGVPGAMAAEVPGS